MLLLFPLLLLFLAAIIVSAIRIVMEYQRGIIFTLGRYSGVLSPGINFVIPLLQTAQVVDMRIKTVDIPKQEVITKDNIPVFVNTVVYFKVENPVDAVTKIENYVFAVAQYTQTALRDVVGNSELDFVLTEREKIAEGIKKIVDSETSGWGVDIASIKIQEIELPAEMKRAMAKQAEAERERRAQIIVSEGELAASENLRKASENLMKSPGALHLRTLQTIRDIAQDPSEKIVLFLPSDVSSLVGKLVEKK
ncbi:MAG: slipin family protein [Candidatus Diapherotrites archaeon]|nr:slipin family protein [Candidatus Diapherotrites archaeon]